jgi:hypothetical protein
MHPLEIFFLVSGAFSILATIPLVYLALRSHLDAREVRRLQLEVTELMVEVREVQHAMHSDQQVTRDDVVRTKETVERVAHATARRRLPRIRLEFDRA